MGQSETVYSNFFFLLCLITKTCGTVIAKTCVKHVFFSCWCNGDLFLFHAEIIFFSVNSVCGSILILLLGINHLDGFPPSPLVWSCIVINWPKFSDT